MTLSHSSRVDLEHARASRRPRVADDGVDPVEPLDGGGAARRGSPRSTPVARSAVSTRQPSRRSRSAVAAPMPRLAPVTSATLSREASRQPIRASTSASSAGSGEDTARGRRRARMASTPSCSCDIRRDQSGRMQRSSSAENRGALDAVGSRSSGHGSSRGAADCGPRRRDSPGGVLVGAVVEEVRAPPRRIVPRSTLRHPASRCARRNPGTKTSSSR